MLQHTHTQNVVIGFFCSLHYVCMFLNVAFRPFLNVPPYEVVSGHEI